MHVLVVLLALAALFLAVQSTPVEQQATSGSAVAVALDSEAAPDVNSLADVDAGDAHSNAAGRKARLFGLGIGFGVGYRSYGYRPYGGYGYGHGYGHGYGRGYGYGYGHRPYYGYGGGYGHHHHYGYYG